MMTLSKRPSGATRRDENDDESRPLPTFSEALIIASAAVIALFALYEIHDSLDRVSQSVTDSAAVRSTPATDVGSAAETVTPQRPGLRTDIWSTPLAPR